MWRGRAEWGHTEKRPKLETERSAGKSLFPREARVTSWECYQQLISLLLSSCVETKHLQRQYFLPGVQRQLDGPLFCQWYW